MVIFGRSKTQLFDKDSMVLFYDYCSLTLYHFPELICLADITYGKMILDVGCGTAPSLDGKSYDFDYVGVDRSEKMLERAKKRNGIFIRADARQLPLRHNYFDGVISYNLVQHIDTISAVRQMVEVLKPEGKIVIVTNPTAAEKVESVLKEYGFQDIENVRPKISMMEVLKDAYRMFKIGRDEFMNMDLRDVKTKEELMEVMMKKIGELVRKEMSPPPFPYVIGTKPKITTEKSES